MKKPHFKNLFAAALAFLFFFVLSFPASAGTTDVIRNGGFANGISDWNLDPDIDSSWNPLSDGWVNLHPPVSGYTGTVISQSLNVGNIGGKTLSFSMDLVKGSASYDNVIQVELTYVTTSNSLAYVDIDTPGYAEISVDRNSPTVVSEDIAFPSDARKLVKISILKENYGQFYADNISLTDSTNTVTVGAVPQIATVSSSAGAYGSLLTLTGQNFGGTQGLISVGGSSDGVSVISWSNSSVTLTVSDPVQSGSIYVICDYVESNMDYSFEVTSPHYAVDMKYDELTVVKGQVAEYLIALEFFNDFSTTGGITFSIDPATLPQGAVATFNPSAPMKNAGGCLLNINTTSVAPGEYDLLLKAEEAGTEPRYVPFTMEVTTIYTINFSQWVYDPVTYGSTKVPVSEINLTAQGQLSLDIEAVDTMGNTWTTMSSFDTGMASPLSLTSSNPAVLAVNRTTWGTTFYALTSGSANIIATASDGTEAQLPVTITIGIGDPYVAVGLSPTQVNHNYSGDISFSATGSSSLGWVGTSTSGTVNFSSNFSDNGDWYNSNMSYASIFQLVDQEPGVFTVIFSASLSGGAATGYALLDIVADPALAQLKGGVRTLDDTFAEFFIIEFYDASGTKVFQREVFSYHERNFQLVGIPVGSYRIKLTHEGMVGQTSQWYPNADSIEDAQAITFTAGGAVEDIYFFLKSPPSLSFSGSVRASDVTAPTDGTAISGAYVTSVDNANVFAYTDGAGDFTLNNLPISTPFALHITATGYVPVYSQTFNAAEDIATWWPYVMFTPTELALWPTNVWQAGMNMGLVTGRVVSAADYSQTIEGVTVTATSGSGTPYNVYYFDGNTFYSGAEAVTSSNGLYYVCGVTGGDSVTLGASKDGMTFGSFPVFAAVHADSVHEGLIIGRSTASQGISFTGTVKNSNGASLEGVTVEMAGNPSITTETEADGSFTLSGLPVQINFSLKMSRSGFADTYSRVIRSGADINGSSTPFVLLTATELGSLGIASGKGVITGRVLNGTSGAAVSGAVLSYTSSMGETYSIIYPDEAASATASSGRYMIPNVVDGDMVTVSATYSGVAFNASVFNTHGDSVSQGIIFGSTDSDTLNLRNAFDTAMGLLNAKDLDGFMAYVSDSYNDGGTTKALFEDELAEELMDPAFAMSYTVLSTSVEDNLATMIVLWEDGEVDLLYFINENGEWKLYGNQESFEVNARSGHQANSDAPETYWVSLEVEDQGGIVTSVTVEGDGIASSISLYHNEEEQRWQSWSQEEDLNPRFGNTRPALPLTYTFTVNYGTDQQATKTATVTNFVEAYPSNPSPAEGSAASGELVFSWTPVPGYSYRYGVELYSAQFNRIWEKYDVQGASASYDGDVALERGTYIYNISTGDMNGNYSILQTTFTYQPPGPVPSLGQAIMALQVVTGKNPSGLEAIVDINNNGKIGVAEAIYVLQTNAGLITPLPISYTSGAATLTSWGWLYEGEVDGRYDGFQFSTNSVKVVEIINVDPGMRWNEADFYIEDNIFALAPGVGILDMGSGTDLDNTSRVPTSGYGYDSYMVNLESGHVYAFKLADGTYAAIEGTSIMNYDEANDRYSSTFNYKYQSNGTANF